jgi:hypothetical protein
MKNLTKIVLFVLFVTVGIVLINNSLTAATKHCNCVEEIALEQTCETECALAGTECLYVYWTYSGCQYHTCVTIWQMICLNGAKGYIYSEKDNCTDCYDIQDPW